MGLSGRDLVLACLTVRHAGFAERVAAAAAAGFRGIGLRPSDRDRAHAEGLDDTTMRAMMADHAIEVCEIETLFHWGRDGEAGRQAEDHEHRLLELADALGGRCMVAAGDVDGGVDAAAERLAAVAGRAADHGIGVAVEFLPWTNVDSAAVAWEIVRRSGAPNAGLCVDAWHHFRGGGDDAGLRTVPGDRVLYIQLDDAGPAVGDVIDDTLHHRRLPGDGDFDLAALIGTLRAVGADAPWSIEVLSREMDALPAAEAARRCAAAARRVLGWDAI